MLNFISKIYAQETKDVTKNVKLPKIGGTEASLDTVMKTLNETIIPIALDAAIIVGIFMILYSAFLYVSSFGEESKAETAKKTLLWSIVGTAVVFLARTLVIAVDKFLG